MSFVNAGVNNEYLNPTECRLVDLGFDVILIECTAGNEPIQVYCSRRSALA